MGAVNLNISNTKLTTKMGIGLSFTLPATDVTAGDPILRAGVIAPAAKWNAP